MGAGDRQLRGARHPSDPPQVDGKYLSNAKALSQGALCSQHGRRQDSRKPSVIHGQWQRQQLGRVIQEHDWCWEEGEILPKIQNFKL